MRIANYLRPDCVALRQRADSLTGAVQQLVTLLDRTDNLTDTAVFAADVRARLAVLAEIVVYSHQGRDGDASRGEAAPGSTGDGS